MSQDTSAGRYNTTDQGQLRNALALEHKILAGALGRSLSVSEEYRLYELRLVIDRIRGVA